MRCKLARTFVSPPKLCRSVILARGPASLCRRNAPCLERGVGVDGIRDDTAFTPHLHLIYTSFGVNAASASTASEMADGETTASAMRPSLIPSSSRRRNAPGLERGVGGGSLVGTAIADAVSAEQPRRQEEGGGSDRGSGSLRRRAVRREASLR